eukprot:1265604-Amphidinium_carterae.1
MQEKYLWAAARLCEVAAAAYDAPKKFEPSLVNPASHNEHDVVVLAVGKKVMEDCRAYVCLTD